MNLFQASRQWAVRPDDERFSTLSELHSVVTEYRSKAAESRTRYDDLVAGVRGGDVAIASKKQKNAAGLTHWAFGQLAQRAGAPSAYLRELPAQLAADCVNHGLRTREHDEYAQLMFHTNGKELLLRAITSERYTRIWNSDITTRLLRIGGSVGSGWRVPPARPVRANQPGARKATKQDVLDVQKSGLSIKVGDLIAPAGLYASDHDMFVFMVDEDKRIDDGTPEGLSRGFFCWNSEVGAATFGLTAFLYRHVCGNHIVWDAKNVMGLKFRHVGNADDRAFRAISAELVQYSNASASDEEVKIQSARRIQLGKTKDEVLDRIFKLRIPVLTKQRAEDAYQIAEMFSYQDGSPRSVWGMTQGITRLSQETSYADDRVALDRAAGKVLQIAF